MGSFQNLLDPIGLVGSLAHQDHPITCQLTQFPLGTCGNEAGTQQPMPQEVGNPFRVAHIRLAARHCLYVASIDHEQFEGAFQQVINRFPKDPGRLHRHMRAGRGIQPLGQCEQVSRHRAKRPHLLLHRPIRSGRQEASDHQLLMNVQSTTALIQQLHGALPLSSETASGSPLRLELLVCVLLRRGRQTVVPGRTLVKLFLRARSTSLFPTFARWPSAKSIACPAAFSSAVVAHRAMINSSEKYRSGG
jgi:hypothetical protein